MKWISIGLLVFGLLLALAYFARGWAQEETQREEEERREELMAED